MSEFVNYNKRDVNLPPGCKNLMDILNQEQSGGERHPLATEEQFTTKGLVQVGRFVALILDSNAELCAVKISGIDLPMNLNFFRVRSENLLSIWTIVKDPQQVNAIRGVLERERLAPLWDRGLPKYMLNIMERVLAYQLPNDAARATSIIIEVLRTSEGLTDESGLNFRFHESGFAPAP